MFNHIRGLTLADFSKCAPCPHRGYCSHDRGAAFTATGDYTGADPFVCATADLTHKMAADADAECESHPDTGAPAEGTAATPPSVRADSVSG